jgi:hypothetical protein
MKKLIIIVLCVLVFGQISGQITISSSDMPASGDTIRSSIGVNPGGVYDFVRTGNNLIWDFSGLENMGQQVDTFLTVTQTPIIFWPFFLTSSNLAKKISGAGFIPGLPVESAYQYFSKTSSSFTDIGTGLVFSGLPIPLKYSEPDVLYRFPMSIGWQDTVDSFLEVSVPDLGYLMVDRNRINHVDGWGVLKSPYGEFDVLRLKSTVSEYDSIFIDSLGIGFPIQRNYIEYKWIGQGFGLPLLQVTIDEFLAETIVFLDSVRDVNVGVADHVLPNRQTIIWPNPANDFVYLDFSGIDEHITSLSLTDQTGRKCFQVSLPLKYPKNIPFRVNLADLRLSKGLYTIIIHGQQQVHTAKLIIGH